MATKLNFADAIVLLRGGVRMQRAGWNGKGMFVFQMPGYPEGVPANAALARASGVKEGELVRVLPYLMQRIADGTFVPWLAAPMDLLADDWQTHGTPDTIEA